MEKRINNLNLLTKSALMNPDRVVDPFWWAGHIPFAMWLVEKARPRTIVELGVHIGNSYFAMCHSVKSNELSAQCYAVDTWKGDLHQGFYEDNIYHAVKQHNENNFSSFSHLLRMTFDQAVLTFKDHSVDLLHIDGFHTYEAVKHDFETWFPKLSDQAIVLLHDVEVKKLDFGVWQLWDELSVKYPNILFKHSQGLGVLFVGKKQPSPIRDLLDNWAAPEGQDLIQQYFARLGQSIESEHVTANLNQTILKRDEQIAELNQVIAKRDMEAAALHEKVNILNRTILELNNEELDFNEKLNNLNRTILERDKEAAALNENVNSLNRTILERDKEAAALHEKVNILNQAILELNNEELDFNEKLNNLNRTILERDKEIAELNEKANALNRSIIEREERIADLNNRLFQIESSLKWYAANKTWNLIKSVTPQFVITAIKRGIQRNRQAANRSQTGQFLHNHQTDSLNSPDPLVSPSPGNPPTRIPQRRSALFHTIIQTAGRVLNLIPGYRTIHSIRVLKRSGLFDVEYYLAQNPSLRKSGVNPIRHYLTKGWKEHLNPGPHFNSDYYLQQNPDVLIAGINPLLHYIEHGAAEGRAPWLLPLSQNQDAQGHSCETTPSPLFSAATAKPHRRYRPSESLPKQSIVYAFTSICLNYIPKAVVLAETLKKHNPQVRFCLLVNEPIPAGLLDSFDVFDEIATLDDLNIPNKQTWLFGHTVVELCTAVKGFFILELLERPECKTAFYFDPDIAVFSSIDVLLNSLENSSILLTPHQTEPEKTIDTIIDNEICSLKHGIYNLGFLGVKSSAEGLRFARWWRDRLHHFCRADIPAGLFTDQRWIDLVPSFFTDFHILRHPGCNVSTWNLTHRRVEGNLSSGFTVNQQPLIFYHFSGFDSGAQEIMLNKYGKNMPAARVLRQWYLTRTERPEDKNFSSRLWKYNYFTNGELITPEQRRLFRDRIDLQQAFPNPFLVPETSVGFYQWYQAEIVGRRPGEQSNTPHTKSSQNPASLHDSGQKLIEWSKTKNTVILFVGHYGDGGTEKHIRELAECIEKHAGTMLLTPQSNGLVRISALSTENGTWLDFDPVGQFDKLAEFIEACKIERLHIHHLFGNEHYLESLVRRLNKPFDFTVHDYYTLAPTPQLIGPNNRFVGENLEANSNAILSMSICPKLPKSLSDWQSRNRWVLTDAARVIVPSQDAARRMKANVPTLQCIVVAHPDQYDLRQPIHLEKTDAKTPLRIAILGQISQHKGYELIHQCAKLAKHNKYPLSFDLIGLPLIDADTLVRAGVRISGQYKDSYLQSLIRERRPHLIWYPALWPETYSYTLSAAFKACLPVVVPNLGAFPERVAGRQWSWVCPWDYSPKDWTTFFLHIREVHFLAGIAPECPAGTPPKTDNFYEHEYLHGCTAPS